jgi:RimJ/RimL family protein N-acetyltransferase
MPPEIQIRPIQLSDFSAYKSLRLEGLQSHPEAFGSDHAEQSNDPGSIWLNRIRSSEEGIASRMFLAEATSELAGITAVYRETGVKVRHSANVVSVYVRPKYRGRHLAEQLIHNAIAWAASMQIRIVRLTVVTTNAPAIRCYHRCGFQIYGVAPEVIRVGDTYYDELLMWRRVT